MQEDINRTNQPLNTQPQGIPVNNIWGNDELGLSKTILDVLTSNSPMGLYIMQDHKFVYVNHRMEQILGFGRGELTGTPALSHAYPEDRDFIKQQETKSLKGDYGEVHSYQFRAVTKSGEIRWMLETIAVFRNKNGRATLGYVADITERKKTEEALRISENKFRSLVEYAHLGISFTTLDGRILSLNQAMLDLFGYKDREQFLKEPITTRYANPQDRQHFIETLQRDGIVKNFEVLMKKTDDTPFWCSLSAIAQQFDADIKGLIAIGEDISKRKETEIALQNAKIAAEAATQA